MHADGVRGERGVVHENDGGGFGGGETTPILYSLQFPMQFISYFSTVDVRTVKNDDLNCT